MNNRNSCFNSFFSINTFTNENEILTKLIYLFNITITLTKSFENLAMGYCVQGFRITFILKYRQGAVKAKLHHGFQTEF